MVGSQEQQPDQVHPAEVQHMSSQQQRIPAPEAADATGLNVLQQQQQQQQQQAPSRARERPTVAELASTAATEPTAQLELCIGSSGPSSSGLLSPGKLGSCSEVIPATPLDKLPAAAALPPVEHGQLARCGQQAGQPFADAAGAAPRETQAQPGGMQAAAQERAQEREAQRQGQQGQQAQQAQQLAGAQEAAHQGPQQERTGAAAGEEHAGEAPATGSDPTGSSGQDSTAALAAAAAASARRFPELGTQPPWAPGSKTPAASADPDAPPGSVSGSQPLAAEAAPPLDVAGLGHAVSERFAGLQGEAPEPVRSGSSPIRGTRHSGARLCAPPPCPCPEEACPCTAAPPPPQVLPAGSPGPHRAPPPLRRPRLCWTPAASWRSCSAAAARLRWTEPRPLRRCWLQARVACKAQGPPRGLPAHGRPPKCCRPGTSPALLQRRQRRRQRRRQTQQRHQAWRQLQPSAPAALLSRPQQQSLQHWQSLQLRGPAPLPPSSSSSSSHRRPPHRQRSPCASPSQHMLRPHHHQQRRRQRRQRSQQRLRPGTWKHPAHLLHWQQPPSARRRPVLQLHQRHPLPLLVPLGQRPAGQARWRP
jgi:hypothetical protein